MDKIILKKKFALNFVIKFVMLIVLYRKETFQKCYTTNLYYVRYLIAQLYSTSSDFFCSFCYRRHVNYKSLTVGLRITEEFFLTSHLIVCFIRTIRGTETQIKALLFLLFL